MDKAMAIDTASGKPSGMATMRITTAVMKHFPTARRVSFEKKSCSSDMETLMITQMSCVIKHRKVAKIAYFSTP